MKRLIKFKSKQGHKDGPAISGLDGKILNRDVLDDALHEICWSCFKVKGLCSLGRSRQKKISSLPIRFSEP